MQRMSIAYLLLLSAAPLSAQPPSWDARGVGPLPRMGITSIDVADDGKEIVVGTIAAFGDPNVIVLDDAGHIARTYRVGQQWIDNVAFLPGSKEIVALCTMPAGKAGDRVEAFQLKTYVPKAIGGRVEPAEADAVVPLKLNQDTPWFFHYGAHSNHPTMKLARAKSATAILSGNQVIVYRKDKPPATLRVPVSDPDASVSLAIDEHGFAVVGCTSRDREGAANLFLFDPDRQKPVWSRAVNKDVDKAPPLEKGIYGKPTLPDGTRAELPQRDEKVWAPLSVAIQTVDGKRLIAAADYQGWQRWVRSSATMKEENQGLRFVPVDFVITSATPKLTVYDPAGEILDRRGYIHGGIADLRFSSNGKTLYAWPQIWKSRGLGGQPVLPIEGVFWQISPVTIGAKSGCFVDFGGCGPISDVALGEGDSVIVTNWHEKKASVVMPDEDAAAWPGKFDSPGARFVRFLRTERKLVFAETSGILTGFDLNGKKRWRTNLNTAVPKSLKPWVANARATPIVKGVWQIPGGRVESDLGGQRVIEAPDGLILIEGHAGLSFEREWAAMEAVGLNPMNVKYVLATHEHGDHAPGAYLWRVITGAKFVCSEEMAYTLQHHIPGNSGYGLHPPVPTDIVIKKDQELDLAGLKVRAVRIPGHTAGSMAWYFEKSGEKFVAFGDLIMPRGVLGYSGSVNFSARDVLSSLKKLRDLHVDYVLPGHGAVEGPANYFHAGIDVGQAVGWGFIKPEKPDPRFRLTQKNVMVAGWGHGATSAAFGDVNGDGKPDVVIVAPDGEGSIIKIFLNRQGKFNDQPDHEIKVPTVSQPHKVRIQSASILVAGKTAAVLLPNENPAKGKAPSFRIIPFDLADGNHLRFLGGASQLRSVLVSRRFGGFYEVPVEGKPVPRRFEPAVDGPYVDFRLIGDNADLLTSYGQLYPRGTGNKLSKTPVIELPREKDWQFLAIGAFKVNSLGTDVVLLSYGMDKATTARVFYGTGKPDRPFADKADAVIPLSPLLASAKKNQTASLVRDTPVVADWNGDGIHDLIVAHGQSDEVLIFLGGKDGLSKDRVQRIQLEYRVHYEHGVFAGDFNGDGKMDLAVFGYTNTGVGAGGPPAAYIWLQP